MIKLISRDRTATPFTFYILYFTFYIFFLGCSPQKQINKTAKSTVLGDSALQHAYIGISIYDPSSGKYLYNHNGASYFVPASNTKIVTCYAAMKYLGDSLPGIKYMITDKGMLLIPTGDPSLLHADYKVQPVIDFLKKQQAPLFISDKNWQTDALGAGWAWSDYNFYYSAERSALPVYGNILTWTQEMSDSSNDVQSPFIYSLPEVNWKVRFNPDTTSKRFYVQRQKDENVFVITEGKENKKVQEVPFVTHGVQSALELLKDTIGKEIQHLEEPQTTNRPTGQAGHKLQTIFSQKTDSVLKPMMHRSDNFFAEQLLLMVANERFGVLSEDKIIDTLLKSDLKDLPQKPGWADGSGLSRFNLFTPQDFIVILSKMQNEFGMDRLKDVFQTGGEGTLSNYYKQDSGFIFAKTGSLNGVLALSGYLYTNNNKLLLFSVLINNHRGNTTAIRRQVEAFLGQIRKKY